MFENWLVWSLGAAVVWGAGQIFVKNSLSRFSPLAYNLISVPLDVLLLLPFAISFGFDFKRFAPTDFLLLALITSSYTLYYYVVSMNKISLSGTVLSIYPLATVFFAVLFLGEELTGSQLIWILVLMTGVVLIGWPTQIPDPNPSDPGSSLNPSTPGVEGWFLAAAGTAVFVGLADFLAKGLIDRVGVGNYLFFYGWAFVPANLIAFGLDKEGRTWPKLKLSQWPPALLGAALLVLGSGFFFTALSKGPASLVVPISSLYATITVVLSLIFLKERLTKFQTLGVALVVLGVVLISA